MTPGAGVSFVLPVYNGRRWLRAVLEGIEAQRDGRPFEILVVEDGSCDGSARLLAELAGTGAIRLLAGPGRGAAAAINTGIREAAHPIVCQVDQDVILRPGWLLPLIAALERPDVAAAQGRYIVAEGAGPWARAMGHDLDVRYARLHGSYVDHVCTGNTAYRKEALYQVGLLDETLGYGYDNDLSYRLSNAGYRLAFCRQALAVHRWREDAAGYLRQQYGVGYGRLDLIARHPRRVSGDDVSGVVMMAHAPLMLLGLIATAAALAASALGLPTHPPAIAAVGVVGLLTGERLLAGLAAWRRTGDRWAPGLFLLHLARDAAWAWATIVWIRDRLLPIPHGPSRSMPRRPGSAIVRDRKLSWPGAPGGMLAVIPAHNEVRNLERVVQELRRLAPELDVLVVDDGSTDGTAELLPRLGVRWLTMVQRVGVGGAVRAGLRYAAREGYGIVVRVDGDGQHRPSDISRLLRPFLEGMADAVVGSRYLNRGVAGWSIRRLSQTALAACLTLLTSRRVTDPTSGLWLFGPRAIGLLQHRHPKGYAEPELLLLLHHHQLRVAEVPIRVRPRRAGVTTLTPWRAAAALARTSLVLLRAPFRQPGRLRTGE